MKQSFADILQGLDGDRARKLARKLPAWAAAGVEIPSALSLEQCSSEAAALYKARLAREAVAALRQVLDLTGGLGVDSWALSQVADEVVCFERDADLAAAAGRNFARLGADNIRVRCETVTPQTELPGADLIYADPARRDAAGRKVFLLEDCTPDILTLLPEMFRKAPVVLLKLSPMADLAMLTSRLGPSLHEIHVVELDGEVKELLCLLRRDPAPAGPDIIAVRLSAQARLRFHPRDERGAVPAFAQPQPGNLLLEPVPALLKAGAFNLPCTRWDVRKLAVSTHLYLSTSLPADAMPWFKSRRILEVLPAGNASFKQIKRRHPQAEVTARNLPLRSEALRAKMGVSPGGDTHIFGCRLADGTAVLLACKKDGTI